MTRLLKRISVKARISLIIMLSILSILISLAFNYVQYGRVSELVNLLYRHPVTVSNTLNQIELNVLLIHREMKDIASGKDIQASEKLVYELHINTLKEIEQLNNRFLGDPDDVKNLRQLIIDWQLIRQKVFNYRSLNRTDLAYQITTTEGAVHTERISDVLQKMRSFADKKLQEFYNSVHASTYESILISGILAFVTIVFFLLSSYMVFNSINAQLKKLSRFSRQVSQGDLLAELDASGNNEIDQLGQEMLQMRDSLKELIYKNETQNKQLLESEKLAALGGLVTGVAHEVNTPLGISITATSVIQDIRDQLNQSFKDQTLTSEQFEELMKNLTVSSNMLAENLNRGTRLIHDFRLTAVDQISDNRCSFNIKEILKALLSSMYPETRKVPVVPVITGNDELMMNSKPGSVTQVISNLIVNSVQHAFYDQTEPEIEISFRESGNNIIFEYRDNGCGIPESLHERVFEPFYSSSKRTGKSGLGLNLVQTLIQTRLQGNYDFNSSPNNGVHFIFTLPKELKDEELEI